MVTILLLFVPSLVSTYTIHTLRLFPLPQILNIDYFEFWQISANFERNLTLPSIINYSFYIANLLPPFNHVRPYCTFTVPMYRLGNFIVVKTTYPLVWFHIHPKSFMSIQGSPLSEYIWNSSKKDTNYSKHEVLRCYNRLLLSVINFIPVKSCWLLWRHRACYLVLVHVNLVLLVKNKFTSSSSTSRAQNTSKNNNHFSFTL